MILQKMTLENFRQFRGRQVINFVDQNEEHANVTVIFGENGRGKTGLFRAIMFCLFGERRLSQDGDVSSDELQLVNVSALESNTGSPVKTTVELEFRHRDSNYALRRSILGMLDGGRVIEEIDEIMLYVTSPDGNTQPVKASDVDVIIDGVLDRRVKDYFLFDGEKIERLTRASVEQRKEISAGIRNLLDVDALEAAIKAVGRVARSLEADLSGASTEELTRILKRINENEDAQAKSRELIDVLANDIRHARQEIEKTDRELHAFNEIRHLLERRKSYEDDLVLLDQQVKENTTVIKGLVCKASGLIVAPTIVSVLEHIERQKQKGEIPSEIRRDLIEKILEEKRCICGSAIVSGSDAYAHILEWLKRSTDVSTQDAILNLWRSLSEVRNHFSDDASSIEKILQQYGNLKTSISDINSKIENLTKQIGSTERKDATKLDAHRTSINNGIISKEAKAQNEQAELEKLILDHGRLQGNLNEEKLKVGRNNELARRSILARDTKEALTDIYRQFTQEIKDMIGKSATLLFRQLLDKEGRENLKTIVVNEDYSLQVLDRYRKPFLANISAGQRQIMSISFIAALAKMASKGGKIEIPLFMDTPFGRLSFEHRQNLINQVPAFASQWILLATDTEFRRQEAHLLRNTGKWGKFYLLRSTSEGNTDIIEQDVRSALAILRDEESFV